MPTHVYANGLEIACKATEGTASTAFPDPCWSPPGPPAGPVVIPYGNVAHARDLTNGSCTVFIGGQTVALEDQSYFAISTGNEAVTRAFEQGVASGVIQGKAYYRSWSMDVMIEGKGVARHSDLDGFSATDIYAVGGHGDVWHFDGTTWMQEGFPSNMQLDTVTCAGDGYGYLYVSGMGGTLWRGRNSTWEHLHDSHYTVPWNDALWFENKLWLASDYLLRVWDGKNLVPVTDSDGQELPYSGHMDAHEGLLVVAGLSRVMAYQNGQWRTLVAPYE